MGSGGMYVGVVVVIAVLIVAVAVFVTVVVVVVVDEVAVWCFGGEAFCLLGCLWFGVEGLRG